MEEVFRLRYQVYCTECGFEDPKDHTHGIEKDEYDEHATHFVAVHPEDNKIIGTVRLINNSVLGFPIEKFCTVDLDTSKIPKDDIGEISRLAISKTFRRRVGDGVYGGSDRVPGREDKSGDNRRDSNLPIVMGLLKAIYIESKCRGKINWYAAMERSLFLLLKRLGFVFHPIGGESNYHGYRTPYIIRIGTLDSEIAKKNPKLFKTFTGFDSDQPFEM